MKNLNKPKTRTQPSEQTNIQIRPQTMIQTRAQTARKAELLAVHEEANRQSERNKALDEEWRIQAERLERNAKIEKIRQEEERQENEKRRLERKRQWMPEDGWEDQEENDDDLDYVQIDKLENDPGIIIEPYDDEMGAEEDSDTDDIVTNDQSYAYSITYKTRNKALADLFYTSAKTGNNDILKAILPAVQEEGGINQPNHDLDTALHLAVKSNQAETVRILLDGGANALAKDGLDRTPYYYATPRVAQILSGHNNPQRNMPNEERFSDLNSLLEKQSQMIGTDNSVQWREMVHAYKELQRKQRIRNQEEDNNKLLAKNERLKF